MLHCAEFYCHISVISSPKMCIHEETRIVSFSFSLAMEEELVSKIINSKQIMNSHMDSIFVVELDFNGDIEL